MRNLLALSLVAVLSVTAIADDKPEGKKKGKSGGNQMVTKLMSSLKDIGLSDEQMTSVKAAAEKFKASAKELHEAGLTAEVSKKFAMAQKEAREAGLKGKEIAAKAKESISEEEAAMMEKMQVATMTMKKSVVGVLTEEQIQALPAPVKKQLMPRKGGKGKGKGKKKKEAEAA